MKLYLLRKWFTDESTIGELYLDGAFECFILEDAVRDGPKIPGKTAIPEGLYQVVITYSPRFKRDLPLLVDVPGYEGIRIHPGNDAGNTEGCLLPGQTREENFVGHSRAAFYLLFVKLLVALKAELDISIEITSQLKVEEG